MSIDQMAPRACLFVEPMMIDLLGPDDPGPEQPDDGLHDEDGGRDSSN